MSPLVLILLLVAAGTVLIVADLVLPSGGLLSVLGVGAIVTAVIVCFTIDRWIGLAALVGTAFASPFVAAGLIAAWQRTPVGRALVLDHAEPTPPREVVRVGLVGTTLSALRPMGECVFHGDFGETTIQCKSEFGDLPPGASVRVTHYKDGVATVRRVAVAAPVRAEAAPFPEPNDR